MIVGVVGFIGSGKGTVGEILQNFGFIRESFAGQVKDVASAMFGWPRNLLEGDTKESREFREKDDPFWSKKLSKEFSPRLALQLLGTEIGREFFSPNFWIDTLERKIEASHTNTNYVITDVRFPNEIEWISNKNGSIIEVRRGITPHWYDIASKANKGSASAEKYMLNMGLHPSEWKWIGSNIDHVVENDGTLEELQKKILSCLRFSYGSNTINELCEGVL